MRNSNMKKYLGSFLYGCAIVGFMAFAPTAHAAGDYKVPEEQTWQHHGLFGTFDRAALQRGFQVYKQVCSACHGMDLVSYRNLMDFGYTDDEVRAIAADYTVMDGPNDEGEMFERPAIPADRFVNPYPNQQAARYANGGAYPPDLSLMVKARHYGDNYVYSLLSGYTEAPASMEMMEGMHYNPYFPGKQIGMAAPLSDDMVEYADGTPATVQQMSKDIATFLSWSSDPHQEARKKMGFKVVLFLIIFALLMYFTKKRVWKDLED